jgi:hypothetical protein
VEKERLVLLTEKSLIIIKYDFINLRLVEYKRLNVAVFDRVAIGELKYPDGSFIPSRNQVGVRCMWNKGQELALSAKWNPLHSNIPWLTLTSHPLAVSDEILDRKLYSIDSFVHSILPVLEKLDPQRTYQVIYAPVIIENYAGLVSAFHNISSLGFFKTRGKISF